MADPAPDFLAILRVLAEHEVDFLVIGGVCAVLHGAPISTFDLDVIHSRSEANLPPLLAALHDLDACYRERADQRISPVASRLASPGHHLLMTRAGPLDLIGAVTDGRGYEQLVTNSVEVRVSENVRVRIVDLPTLIGLKETMGRERDKAVLPILRRTLEETRHTEERGE